MTPAETETKTKDKKNLHEIHARSNPLLSSAADRHDIFRYVHVRVQQACVSRTKAAPDYNRTVYTWSLISVAHHDVPISSG